MDSYGFYDVLRSSDTSSVVPVFSSTSAEKTGISAETFVIDPADATSELQTKDDNDNSVTFPPRALQHVINPTLLPNALNGVHLCHIPTFLRYTEATKLPENAMEEDYQPFVELPKMYDASVGVMLAMHHFNNGMGNIVKEVRGINETCDIRLTTELFNTESSHTVAVEHVTSLLARTSSTTNEAQKTKPPPCAILGSTHPLITARMASLTGVFDLPQISPQASLSLLSDKRQYPLFARPTPSCAGSATMAIRYFTEVLGTTHLGVLVPDCPYGLDYEKAIAEAALEAGVTVEVVSMPAHPDTVGPVEQVLGQLKRAKLKHFLAVTFEYDMVMEVAHEMGLAGADAETFWLFTEFREFKKQNKREYPTNSALANATQGVGFIEPTEGLSGENDDHGGYSRFVSEWNGLQNDDQALQYFNSMQPSPPTGASSNIDFTETGDKFAQQPDKIAFLSYDATIGLGLAACEAAKASGGGGAASLFSGEDHLHYYINRDPFDGASGTVNIDPATATRDPSSVAYVVSNVVQTNQNDGLSTFQPKPAVRFDPASQTWRPVVDKTGGNVPFFYADGSTNLPPQLSGIQVDHNYISRGICITGFVLAAIAIVAAIVAAATTFKLRENVVIRAAQPEFLYLLCAGALILASAIIPAGIDDSVASLEGAGVACMSTVWLASSGFCLIFGALCAKTLRVNKIFNNGGRVKRIKVTPKDVVAPLAGIMTCNFLVLGLWTGLSPLEYVREPIEFDKYDRILTSAGKCQSDQGLIYGLILLGVNAAALFFAMYQAYRARAVQVEFGESTYIALIILSLLQALFIGTPLLVISSDNPSALYFIKAAVLFITNVAVLSLMFVPKLMHVRRQSKGGTSNKSTIKCSVGTVRISGLNVDVSYYCSILLFLCLVLSYIFFYW